METYDPVDTPMVEKSKLDEDPQGKAVLLNPTTFIVELIETLIKIMNPQETQQMIARDKKWVPSTERVKISSTNAFTVTAKVPKIFMQQFWYTIKKVKDLESYVFLLANKKCIVDAEVFRKILDICPRVESEKFTEVQDDDATPTFLIDLGYKGPLHKYTNMYVDHIYQPRRTLAAIINKCLSGKTASNDRLRKSKINILWGMFYRENLNVKLREEELASNSSATHARIVTESVPEPARRRPSGIVFRDTSQVSKKVSSDPSQKLKGVQSLTPEEQEATDTMKALKESRKTTYYSP
ncbi:hypothetical protein Tco_0678468 [Tanacetum coccineum]|uniref:Uncharacterized protein n=1 Tax=Tanacetum coccineum TaxID=301880 RepID=A0ABQ4XF50_9ASTR